MFSFLVGMIVGLAGVWNLLKYLFPWVSHDIRLLSFFVKTIIRIKGFKKMKPVFSLTDRLIQQAKTLKDKPFIIFEHASWSYKQINQQSNKIARVLRSQGVQARDTIAVMMTNHPTLVSVWFGTSKAGASPALLNHGIRSQPLIHCINVSKCSKLIISSEESILEAVKGIERNLKNAGIMVYVFGKPPESRILQYHSIMDMADKESDEETPMKWRDHVKIDSEFCYMFTSGTTGLPKAAIIHVFKSWMGANIFQLMRVTPQDIVYTPLPLYHASAGLLGLLGTLDTGCTMVLRKCFSSSHFWEDCREYNVTVVQYIGETLRYVCNQPDKMNDRIHNVRLLFGNGLSPGVWRRFLDRFGGDIRIAEFYTATEANIGFYNIINRQNSVGVLSPLVNALGRFAIIKYDLSSDSPVLDKNGYCIRTDLDEPGLLLGRIVYAMDFAGYRDDRIMTEKKIMHDVFKPGDKYFNSGDIMLRRKDYSVSFVDRIGDTYRWKGENMSTFEVADEMAKAPGIAEANVYGVKVPGTEGRAGMMVVVLQCCCRSLNGPAVYEHACKNLVSCARPLFLRVQQKMELTDTFKQRKSTLVKEGFDLNLTGDDPVYILNVAKSSYVPLTHETLAAIRNGILQL